MASKSARFSCYFPKSNNLTNESNNKIRNLINQMKNNNSSSSAPVMGLNNILSNNGTNIADAVYAIAKS